MLGHCLASQTVYKTEQYKLTICKIFIENSQDLWLKSLCHEFFSFCVLLWALQCWLPIVHDILTGFFQYTQCLIFHETLPADDFCIVHIHCHFYGHKHLMTYLWNKYRVPHWFLLKLLIEGGISQLSAQMATKDHELSFYWNKIMSRCDSNEI